MMLLLIALGERGFSLFFVLSFTFHHAFWIGLWLSFFFLGNDVIPGLLEYF